MSTDLPKPDYARNMRIVAHCDQGGRPDGVQIMVHRGFAYIGHMFSKGFSVIDVRDAKRPRAVNYLPAPAGTWNIHLQTHDDLLLVINAKDMFAAAEFADEKAYWNRHQGVSRARQLHSGAVAPVVAHQAQGQAKQGRDLSTLAPVRALRARPPVPAWARRAVGEGVKSCPRAGCGRSACPVRNKSQLGKAVGTADRRSTGRDWTAGLAVYDISKPDAPRRIGFMAVEGGGIHRIWYTGGPWTYVSALLDGFTDYIFMCVDMRDPVQPRESGRYWIPGMKEAAGETATWPATSRYGLHHAIVHGDTAYAAWRDAGMLVLDVADSTRPKLIAHRNWSPPFGGGTHNCLPLPDRDLLIVLDEAMLDLQEDGLKLIWVFDNRAKHNPVSIATFPTPAEADYVGKGGHFGPHNIHENRPGSFVSSELIFATYQNAGVRVFDIRDQYRPREVGALVPPAPVRMMDVRPNRAQVIQSADVFVDAAGLIYSTDYNAGLYIMEFNG
jgi:hypothetical protein